MLQFAGTDAVPTPASPQAVAALPSVEYRHDVVAGDDCFVLDEHSSQALDQDWWKNTFAQCVGRIGHTVMLLSPWRAPIPLTRSWCIWEIYSTVRAATPFDVAMGASALAELEPPAVVAA